MKGPITSEIVVAYSLCPRKAFLLLSGERGTAPHEYVQLIEEQAAANLAPYRKKLLAAESALGSSVPRDLESGRKVIVDATLRADGLEAHCDILRRVNGNSALGRYSYEPDLIVGTYCPTSPQVIDLAYRGYVLDQVQKCLPAMGTLVCAENRVKRVKLASIYKIIKAIVGTLKIWISEPPKEPPPVVLNKHCPCCPFRAACHEKAEKEDHLSLLDRMTPQLMKKYHAKGIFTITSLSYLYKPRRSKKRRIVRHRLELQALAIRTGKTYIEHLPELSRPQVELFVDIEGIPDQQFQYLIGLLVCNGSESRYHTFWANTVPEEEEAWKRFITQVQTFPSAPIYHYGDYERKAFKALAQKYGVGREEVLARLANISQWVYGRVYFPVRSNSLKEIGRFLGAAWRSSDASGLQSLVWRHRWEEKHEERHKKILLEYNEDDCRALRLLFDKLIMIKETGDTEPTIDYSRRPKQQTTERGTEIHRQFDLILKSAYDVYERNKLLLHALKGEEGSAPKRKGFQKGHQTFRRTVPSKAGRIIRVAPKRKCPKHHCTLVPDTENLAEKTVIDLVFTKNGCRKTITKYVGEKSYCPRCSSPYNPPSLHKNYKQVFGHGFQAWTIYQRVILRLPYCIITQATEHLFGVGFSKATVVSFLGYLADYYQNTDQVLLQAMRESPFIHVDETKINIQGENNYVWVFTDGKHVVFRLTETREADIVHTILAGYSGVLVSDFYPGYDSVSCRQQKCLVHLVRDLNEDLWDSPFDQEYRSEEHTSELQSQR